MLTPLACAYVVEVDGVAEVFEVEVNHSHANVVGGGDSAVDTVAAVVVVMRYAGCLHEWRVGLYHQLCGLYVGGLYYKSLAAELAPDDFLVGELAECVVGAAEG